MNKNIIIGALAVVVIIGAGFYFAKNNTNTPSYVTPPANTNNTQPNNTVTVDTSVPPLVLGAPVVQTSQSTSASSSTATVTGQVNPSGVPTTYWFEYGDSTTLTSRTTSEQIGSGYSFINAPEYITGLRSSTTYYYRLMGYNSFGTVYGATYTFKTNTNPALKAAKPTVRTDNATNLTRTTASLNGQVGPNGWQTNYWFEYGKDKNLGSTTSITSVDAGVSLGSTSNVSNPISSLQPLTKYYFRLNAQNQYGTVNGGVLSFTTGGPLNINIQTGN